MYTWISLCLYIIKPLQEVRRLISQGGLDLLTGLPFAQCLDLSLDVVRSANAQLPMSLSHVAGPGADDMRVKVGGGPQGVQRVKGPLHSLKSLWKRPPPRR